MHGGAAIAIANKAPEETLGNHWAKRSFERETLYKLIVSNSRLYGAAAVARVARASETGQRAIE